MDMPDVAALLAEADAALNEGDYSRSVRRSVEAYQRLVERHPELVVRPGVRQPASGPLLPDRPRTNPRMPWNSTMGVRQSFDAGDKPVLTFERDRFSMSEAVSYYEYVRDLAKG